VVASESCRSVGTWHAQAVSSLQLPVTVPVRTYCDMLGTSCLSVCFIFEQFCVLNELMFRCFWSVVVYYYYYFLSATCTSYICSIILLPPTNVVWIIFYSFELTCHMFDYYVSLLCPQRFMLRSIIWKRFTLNKICA
jgi:hypothetical protein